MNLRQGLLAAVPYPQYWILSHMTGSSEDTEKAADRIFRGHLSMQILLSAFQTPARKLFMRLWNTKTADPQNWPTSTHSVPWISPYESGLLVHGPRSSDGNKFLQAVNEHAQKSSLNLWARKRAQTWDLASPLGKQKWLCQHIAWYILASREGI